MRKYLLLIFLSSFLFLGSFQSNAQCPTIGATTVNTCDFASGGVITITFTDGGATEHQNYILFDVNGPVAVSSPFGSVTKSYNPGTQTLTYGNIPDGTYIAGNSADGCPAIGGAGIVIDQTNELSLFVNNVIDDCDNLGSGEIDINTVGGDAPYSYSWSGALPDQEDQTGLSAGSYDVTVTDADNCTFTLTGIVVEEGPDAGTPANATVCNTVNNFDLFGQLTGEDGGGVWTRTGGTGSGEDDTNIGTGVIDFTGSAAGTYIYQYEIPATASCPNATANVTITVEDAPDAGTPTDATICNTVNNFDLFGQLAGEDGSGVWTRTGGTGSGEDDTNIGTGTIDFTGATAGTYVYQYEVPATANCPLDQSALTITVEEAPDAGTPSDATVCNTVNNFDLFGQLTGEDGGGVWTRTGGTGSGEDDTNIGTGVIDFTGSAAGTYIYQYEIPATASCPNATANVTITVEDAPDAGTPTDATICNTVNNFDLFGQLAGEDGSGVWTRTGGTGSGEDDTNIGTGTIDFTGATAGTYVYQYEVPATANCPLDQSALTITVEEAPDAGTPSDATVCNTVNNFDLFGQLTGEDGGGVWTRTGGTGSGEDDTNIGTGVIDFTGSAAGTYIYQYEIPATASCPNATANVTITVEDAPDAGTPTDATICNTVNNFDLFGQLAGEDGSGVWTRTGGTGSGEDDTNIGTGTIDFTGATAGTYVYQYEVPATANCPLDQSALTITVEEAPDAGTPSDATVCNTVNNFDLFGQLTGEDGGGVWTRTGGTGSGEDDTNIGTGVIDFTGSAAGTYIYQYEIPATASCPNATANVTITVEDAPDAGTPTDATICNTVNNFDLFGQLAGEDGSGVWTRTGGTGSGEDDTNIGTGTIDFTGATAGTYVYQYEVPATANCPLDQSALTITVEEAPDAGTPSDATVCNTVNNFDLFGQLTGEDGGGVWTRTGGTGSGEDDTNIGTGVIDFTGSAAGTYIYQYEIPATASCPNATANVTITVEDAPDAGTPTDATICNTVNNFDLFGQLAGEDGSGVWTRTGGTGSGEDDTNIGTGTIDFTGATAGTYVYQYEVPATANCPLDQSALTITVEEAPDAGTPSDATVCNTVNNFDLFGQLTGEDGGGVWTRTGGTGSGEDDTNIGTGVIDFTGSAAGTYIYQYEIPATASCPNATANVTITVEDAPDAGTPTDATICNTVNNFDLFGQLAGEDGSGVWTRTGGTGSGEDDTNIGTGTIDFTGATAGTYVYQYEVPATANCPLDQSALTITVEEAPDAGTPSDATVCNTVNNFDLFGQLTGEDGGGVWTRTGGTGSGEDDTNIGTGVIDFTGSAAGTYIYQYEIPATASCPNATANVTITVEDAPDAGTPTDATICNTVNNFDLFGQLAGEDGSGVWTRTGGTGSGEDDTNIGTGTIDFTGATAGTYVYQYEVPATANCPLDQSALTITVEEAPDAGTPSDATVCNTVNNFDLFGQLTGEDGGGVWTRTGGTGSGEDDTNIGTGVIDFTGSAAGTYIYQYEIPATASCPNATANVTITVEDAPDAGTPTDATICNTVNNFDLFGQLAGEDGSGVWTRTGGTGSGEDDTNIGTGTIDFTGATAGTYVYQYEVPATANCPLDQSALTITVEEAPDAGTPSDATVCNTVNNFDLFGQLTGEDGGGVWTRTGGTGSGEDDTNIGTGVIDFTGSAAGTYIYQYEIPATASCPNATANVTITVEDAPDAGTPTDATICNTVNNFDLFGQLAGEDGSGVWTRTGGTGSGEDDTNIGTGTIDFTGATAGTYVYQYEVPATANCPLDQSALTITVEEAPDAGTPSDATVCNTVNNFDLFGQLTGEDGGGVWTRTGGTGSGEDDTNIGTGVIDFTGSAAGTYIYQYEIPATASCPNATANVTITVEDAPDAGTPTDATICNTVNNFDLFGQLAGEDGSGVWTRTGGTGSGEDDTNIGTGTIDFTGATAGTYVYQYEVPATANCPLDQSALTITVEEAPDAGTPSDATVCNTVNNFDLFGQLTGEDGGGVWTRTGGTGSGEDDTNIGTGVIDFTGSAAGTYIYQYEIPATASCPNATANVTITVEDAPDAGTPTDATICNTVNNFDLFGQLAGEDGSGVWTRTGGTGSGEDDTNIGTGTIDFTGATAGTYVYQYEVPATANCPLDQSALTITVEEAPDAGNYLGTPAEICQTDVFDLTTLLNGTQDINGTWTDTDLSGAVITGNSANFTGVPAGSYDFTYEVPSTAVCTSPASEVVTVNINTLSVSLDANNPTSGCGNTDGSLEVTAVSTFAGDTFTFDWSGPNGYTNIITSATDGDIVGLEAGDYILTVTSDNTGCTFTDTYTVDDPVPFSIDDLSGSPQLTCGGSDGSLQIEVSGLAIEGVFYIEDLGGNEIAGSRLTIAAASPTIYNFNSLAPGDYIAFIEEGPCVLDSAFTIDPVDEIAASIASFVEPNCGAADGSITLNVTDVGNDFDVTYDDGINPPTTNTVTATTPTSVSLSGLEQGTYTITITDNTTNCELLLNQVLNEDAQFEIDNSATTVTDISTCGGSDGGVDIVFTGASIFTGPTTYEWKNSAGTTVSTSFSNPDLVGVSSPGDYVLTVQNDGCTINSIVYTIAAPTVPNAGTYDGTIPVVDLSNNPFDLSTLLSGEDANGVWSDDDASGAAITGNNADFTGVSSGTYDFTYTVVDSSNPSCSDSETVTVTFDSFECADTKFSTITEDATCQGIQDGKIFLFLQEVSNASTLEVTVKSSATDSIFVTATNPGSGNLLEVDADFLPGSYEVILRDLVNDCEDRTPVLIGQKQSILPLVNTSDATCDNPVGQIQVTIDGTFDFVLLDSLNNAIETNTTGLFIDLAPASYGIAFNNSGGCQVDTVKNIIINEPTQVSNSALDVTVVEPSCNTTRAQILVNFELEGDYFYQILDTAGILVDSITTDSGAWTTELDTLGLFELVVTNVDNPGLCEPNSRNFNIERSGGFSATVTDKTDIVCFGENTGSVTIQLDGIGSGFYSLDGSLWTEFISGEPITELPARQTILVSDQPGSSQCELSVQVGIEFLSQPIEFAGNGRITLITQASCTVAEEIGEINVPEVIGGVAPYIYTIDGDLVELDANRNITGLARNVNQLTITDDNGCSESFNIRSIVSPNEIRAEVIELSPNNNCVDDPEGISVLIDQATIDNVPGPYNLILNKVNDTITSEYVLDINTNGTREFIISQFDLDNNIPFEKGARYRWTVRAIDDDQACSADNFVTINGGAIIPTFEIESSDVACFQESGSIELFNIVADETIPLNIEVYEGNDIDPTETFTLNALPESGRFLIDQSIYGLIARGDYIIKLSQQPDNCSSLIESENASIFIDAPVAQLNVELVPEPNLPPGVDRERGDMNPMPTTRPDRSNGSISIRLVEPTSGANGYSAQIFLLTPLGGNNSSDYMLPTEAIDFGSDQVITFENLLPGIYEIEYYDSFGCGTDGNRLVFDGEGSSDITVDFDRSPFIPNVFTPNNDGKNDVFRILNLPDDGAELIVTNRTGTIVFRDSNYRSSNLWDGGDSPDGVYFYQLTVDDNVQNGWVEIIRGRR